MMVINLVSSEGWQGLYINGVLVFQGSQIKPYDIILHIIYSFQPREMIYYFEHSLNEDATYKYGHVFPRKFENIDRDDWILVRQIPREDW